MVLEKREKVSHSQCLPRLKLASAIHGCTDRTHAFTVTIQVFQNVFDDVVKQWPRSDGGEEARLFLRSVGFRNSKTNL